MAILPRVSLNTRDALVSRVDTAWRFFLTGEQVDTLHPGLYSKLTECLSVSLLKDVRCSEPWDFQN